MLNLYLVYRAYTRDDDSVIGAFLVKSHAEQFVRECERIGKHSRIRMVETHVSTYGMSEETRRELFAAINPILNRKES